MITQILIKKLIIQIFVFFSLNPTLLGEGKDEELHGVSMCIQIQIQNNPLSKTKTKSKRKLADRSTKSPGIRTTNKGKQTDCKGCITQHGPRFCPTSENVFVANQKLIVRKSSNIRPPAATSASPGERARGDRILFVSTHQQDQIRRSDETQITITQ